jgi:hypothetical protein
MSHAPPRVSFTVKLLVDDHAFLRALQLKRRLKALGESVRVLVDAARTLFWLPPYQAARVRRDMDDRGLDVLTYVQELLARRYEALALALALADEAEGRSASPAPGSER